jgi:hypothetical protein
LMVQWFPRERSPQSLCCCQRLRREEQEPQGF